MKRRSLLRTGLLLTLAVALLTSLMPAVASATEYGGGEGESTTGYAIPADVNTDLYGHVPDYEDAEPLTLLDDDQADHSLCHNTVTIANIEDGVLQTDSEIWDC
jgi:hypothetical protein